MPGLTDPPGLTDLPAEAPPPGGVFRDHEPDELGDLTDAEIAAGNTLGALIDPCDHDDNGLQHLPGPAGGPQ